jgi:hypothetical protein
LTLPRYAGESVLDFSGELSGSLAEHGEIPQQGIAALAVGFQLADRDTCGQLVGLLRRVDHLGEQENVTLHRTSMSLSGPAVPRACEPKIWSSAIPYRSQMSARRPSSTSAPGIITMVPG